MNEPSLPLLVVKLDPNQWNVILAGLGELPLKHALPVHAALMEQLQTQVPAVNGVDPHPSARELADAA